MLNKENIFINLNGYDVLIDIEDSENFVDKNVKITGINSNTFINKKYKLLSNKLNNEYSINPLLLMKNKKQQYMQVLR